MGGYLQTNDANRRTISVGTHKNINFFNRNHGRQRKFMYFSRRGKVAMTENIRGHQFCFQYLNPPLRQQESSQRRR